MSPFVSKKVKIDSGKRTSSHDWEKPKTHFILNCKWNELMWNWSHVPFQRSTNKVLDEEKESEDVDSAGDNATKSNNENIYVFEILHVIFIVSAIDTLETSSATICSLPLWNPRLYF